MLRLCSPVFTLEPQKCARQGFALGTTVLVGAVPYIKVDALLKLILELSEICSSMKGQDIRDCLLNLLSQLFWSWLTSSLLKLR
ncbi:hypothetical protein HAX54_021464 [Datura stramonium]|uniref:Uncharacterized protein n=1 Tax=Datura stramonium TaxID=4076 RepID=A0ABS8UV80_DATST|nr:hypothetical protein [Datura stramonium]